MKTTVRQYTDELFRQFHYYATWLPGSPVELGTIGTMKDKEFTKASHLRNEGILYETDEDTSTSDFDYSSKGAVTVRPKLSGEVPVAGSVLSQADAGVTVEFSRQNAILFRAIGTTTVSIRDQIKLGREIRKRVEEGTWNKRWVVITELIKAESATILISSSVKGKAELKAKTAVSTGAIDIADLQLQLEVVFSKDLSTKIVAGEGLTPLFKVRRGRMK